MPSIEVSRRIELPRSQVWPGLADLGSHVDWMWEARSLEFLGELTTGVGTRMEVETRVGPLRTLDVIEITEWVEGEAIGASHRGLVGGTGRLSLRDEGDATTVVWAEELHFPWWLGGSLTAWLARPVLARIWKANLDRFAASFSAP